MNKNKPCGWWKRRICWLWHRHGHVSAVDAAILVSNALMVESPDFKWPVRIPVPNEPIVDSGKLAESIRKFNAERGL